MNHPSVMFWGLFNELLINDGKRFRQYDDPRPLLKELNATAHQTDPSRLTCFATCVDHREFFGISDLMAWNKYFSWKSAETNSAEFFDKAKADANGYPVGVSEYGSGGSPWQHGEPTMYKKDKFPSNYHPEEYQAICHENYWKALAIRPWLWIKTIWQFSDMMSCIKNEGDTPGQNDKGLVTYNRETKKDAYYFYKANWSCMPEAGKGKKTPMLHLCSKRFKERIHPETEVKAYTTCKEATLFVNGKKISTQKADSMHRVTWNITLRKGSNSIRVTANGGLQEETLWVLK